MRCVYALLAMVALAAGAALPTVEQLTERLSALEAEKSLEHAARLSDVKLDDLTAEQSESADDTLDKVERGGYDSYNPYGGYPYGGYGGYPYGGYGGYPYGGYGGYPPFGGFGGYPSFGGYPFGGGSSSANAVAVSNGGGFFGGSSNANAVAVSGGGGGGFGRRRRDVDAVRAVESAKERIAEIEQKSLNKAEKRAEIDAVKHDLAETLMTDVARKLESVQKIKQLMQSERILSFVNNQAINAVAVATNNGIFGNANAASTATGSGIGRRDLSAANMKADLADSLVADAIQKLKAADEISKVVESERILGSLQSTQNINAIAVSTNNGIFGNSDANSVATGF